MVNPAQRLNNIELSQIRKMFDVGKEDDINLGIGEPDSDIPKEATEAIKNALDEGNTHYTPNKGIIELREKISQKLKTENNYKTDPESVIITNGASEALYMCAQAFFEKNDEVLIPNPGFLSYQACVELAEAKPIPINSRFENGFKIKSEDIEEQITAQTKAIILNSPSNPTGAVIDKEDIKAIAEIAEDNNILVISDEIYEKIIYDSKHYSPGEFNDNTIIINGFSKTYAMTGLRIGYLATNENLAEELLKVHQYTTACASSISQIAALTAMQKSSEYVVNMVKEFKSKRDLITGRLDDMGLEYPMPQGAFYVFPRVDNSEDFVKKALDAGVITVNGKAFGTNGVEHVRMSYSTSYENIEKAMDRIETII